MPAIEVSHLTKEYRLGALQSLKDTVLNAGRRLLGRPVPERPLFKALDDVSFAVEQGEVVGIIGHNGAGKSTLLKMLARVSTPTSGTVKVNGHIAPLIEVGAGFVPDFTGRENVYLNGAILGMRKAEIDRKFDEIVDFAEMAEFIDTPVKRYSSGMQVKLAFAVATSIDAEILIADEVLAVGDLAFQRKCFDRMEELIRRDGRTVLLVSHNLRQVQRLCKRVVMLRKGRIALLGPAQEVCEAFFRQSDQKIAENASRFRSTLSGSGEITVDSVSMEVNGQVCDSEVPMNSTLTVTFHVIVKEAIRKINFGFGFHTTDLLYIATHNSEVTTQPYDLEIGRYSISVAVHDLPLTPGVYSIRFGIAEALSGRTVLYGENIRSIQVVGSIPESMRRGFVSVHADWHLKAIHEMVRPESVATGLSN